jgi:hypothetical protein
VRGAISDVIRREGCARASSVSMGMDTRWRESCRWMNSHDGDKGMFSLIISKYMIRVESFMGS